MKLLKIFGLSCFGFFLLMSQPVEAAPISDCQIISVPGVYTLTANVSTTTTCFTVTADNVTIDGDGYTINGSGGPDDGYGIDADGVTNLEITDVTITNFERAIMFNDVTDSLIENVTIPSPLRYGIFFEASPQNTITGITIDDVQVQGAGDGADAIHINSSASTTIASSTFTNNYRSLVVLDASDGFVLSDNTFTGGTQADVFFAGCEDSRPVHCYMKTLR